MSGGAGEPLGVGQVGMQASRASTTVPVHVLIVGLGYAGTRFLKAFGKASGGRHAEVAYVDLVERPVLNQRFNNVETALREFRPDIAVVSVNDDQHARILEELHGFRGFVVCEKPLASAGDDLGRVEKAMEQTSGFCLDLIERYSEATMLLKRHVQDQHLRLVRANFYWGKDRIHDRRPTCGVTSEVIHALDLVQHVSGQKENLEIVGVLGSRSDFSISGNQVLDSVSLAGNLGAGVVTGYSSFVNVTRKREIDFTFASPQGKLVYAVAVFDTPAWDIDRLRIWKRTPAGEEILLDFLAVPDDRDLELKTIRKLVRLVEDVLGHVENGAVPSQPFPNLATALSLQALLAQIESRAVAPAPVRYVVGDGREFLNEGDWERLG